MSRADSTTLPNGYQAIPEENQKKAKVFFDRGKMVADTGQFEYAIEMYLSGLNLDPENIDAHQALRDISLKRKASGKGDLGMIDRMKLGKSGKDEKQNLLNAEKLLAYAPGDMNRMAGMLQAAQKGGYYDTVIWIGNVLMQTNMNGQKEDYAKYILLKDTYKAIERWDLATQAAQQAQRLKPQDMDLNAEAKNLSAMDAMNRGKYTTAKSFRDSIRDMEGQKKLLDQDKDVRTNDSLLRAVETAESDWQADPNDPVRVSKLVDALLATSNPDLEERAMQLLDDMHARTTQFKWRHKRGQIAMSQLSRRERDLRAAVQANKNDAEAVKQYENFRKYKLEEEFKELTLWVENYPTDSNSRFQLALRLFYLERWDDAIPVFQQVRNDPKFRVKAGSYLGRAFLSAGFPDEAVDTIKAALEEYPHRGDDLSKELFYWNGRALEARGSIADAIKAYSQVAQWEFKYLDVQERIKRLRAAPQ